MGASKNGDNYPWRVTPYIVVCWVLAACGGLMFGYDIGISGMIPLYPPMKLLFY